jgi:hypothetical protein
MARGFWERDAFQQHSGVGFLDCPQSDLEYRPIVVALDAACKTQQRVNANNLSVRLGYSFTKDRLVKSFPAP